MLHFCPSYWLNEQEVANIRIIFSSSLHSHGYCKFKSVLLFFIFSCYKVSIVPLMVFYYKVTTKEKALGDFLQPRLAILIFGIMSV